MSRSYPEQSATAGSQELGPKQPHVLTLADQWHGGGPLAVNRELSIALAELGCRVTARTGSPVQGRPAVEIPGLEIQSLDPIPGLNDRRSQLLRADGLPDDVDVIVGHGRFSGGAASYLRDHFYPRAHVVHFVHVTADEMDRLRGDPRQSNEHMVTERALVGRSDLVVGVGPLLTEEAARLARMCEPAPAVAEMTPGVILAKPPSYNAHQRRPNLLMFCRTDDALKGADIAAAAAGELNARGISLRLTLLGSMADDVVAQERHLSDIAGLPVRVRPYTFDRGAIEAELRGADLVIHPARHEDFGLAPLEAAGFGIPVLVGGHTGVGMFLDDPSRVPGRLGQLSVLHLPAGRDVDLAHLWADRIKTILSDLPRARERALDLREHLGAHHTWQRSTATLLEAVRALPPRLAESGSRTPTAGESHGQDRRWPASQAVHPAQNAFPKSDRRQRATVGEDAAVPVAPPPRVVPTPPGTTRPQVR